jgi:hypothetical protein
MLRAAKRIVGFFVLTAVVFVAALWSASRVRYGGHTLLQYLTGNTLEPGGRYQSLRRFREAESYGHADIAFVGSSHGYRGFDPRLFSAAGYRSYNLSSTNQSPLNTYFVAKRYLPLLAPRIVVCEIYYPTLANDGYESYRDLAVNTPWSWPMFEMALATRHLGAIDYSIAKALGLTPDEETATQQTIEDETYVEGGYCETERQRGALSDDEPFVARVEPRQLAYLVATTRYATSLGARVVWVTHPLPADHLRLVENYAAVRERITGAAEQAGVVYWDYNDRLTLDPLTQFSDSHHLNASGVKAFNRALIDDLANEVGGR